MDNTKKIPVIRRSHFPDRLSFVPIKIRDERLGICKDCPDASSDMHCNVSQKPLHAMAIKRSYQCPHGFWSTYYGS
jgi:hypothetical protein